MRLSNKTSGLLALLMLVVMFFMALFSMKGDSLTMDEKSHLPAGYSYLTQKDMRINPEHPPLVKDLAGIPLLFIPNINFPYEVKGWAEEINGQWNYGHDFLFASGNPADEMIFWGRIPMLFILMLLGFYIFKWTRELYGNAAGLVATFLFAFSPTFLAHGRLVTTDVGAALGIFFATYYFVKALKDPSKKNIIYSGLSLGIAELLKFSAILLFPFFILLAGLWWYAKMMDFKKAFKILFFVFVICFLVIGPVYQYHVWNYPPERQVSDSMSLLSTYGNRFMADTVIWAADKPVLRSYAQYFLGVLMVTQRVAGGNTTYFMGEVSATAWKSYFPIVYLIKESLVFHFFTLIALFGAIWMMKKPSQGQFIQKTREFIKKYLPQIAMCLFMAVYWATSIQGNLNIGVRHLLPVFPFAITLAAGGAAGFAQQNKWKAGLVLILCLFQAVSVIAVYPSFLAYFNCLAGGPNNGYKYAVDSNLDWGQDVKRLKAWADAQGIDKIYIDYFGGTDVKYYFGDRYQSWWGNRNPDEFPKGNYLAVSATLLQGGRGKTNPESDLKSGYYDWLNKYQPVKKIGYSIFVYRID